MRGRQVRVPPKLSEAADLRARAEGNQAVWGSARYDEEYVKVDGVWMFKHLTLTSHFWTPFDKGWVETQFAS